MKKRYKIEYQCEICGKLYATEKEANHCESKPISEDKGVKVGDIILITQGDGKDHRGEVISRFIYDKDWGFHQANRYWHTIGITAKLLDSWGSRQLTFDDYEVQP